MSNFLNAIPRDIKCLWVLFSKMALLQLRSAAQLFTICNNQQDLYNMPISQFLQNNQCFLWSIITELLAQCLTPNMKTIWQEIIC
jgi:type II restriction/modification system DNA methylase subunit YeeA